MKRFLALFTAILLVCLSLPVFAAAEEEKPLWLVKYNDATIEGAGVVFTEKYEGAAWWFHAAFVPTDVEGVWKITEICDGIEDSVVGGAGGGKAQPLAIPEGGFVYAINVGNDYPTLYPNEANTVDYTSEACTACIQDIQANWKVGTLVKFTGIDFEGFTIPTTTPDIKYYDDGYKCTATYSIYTGTANEISGAESSEPAEDSSATDEPSSAAAESSSDSSAQESAAESASDPSADSTDSGNTTPWLWIGIAAAVVIAAVVVIFVTKKKK